MIIGQVCIIYQMEDIAVTEKTKIIIRLDCFTLLNGNTNGDYLKSKENM